MKATHKGCGLAVLLFFVGWLAGDQIQLSFSSRYARPETASERLTEPPPPADPAVVQRILRACTESGLFRLAGGALEIAVPAAPRPQSL